MDSHELRIFHAVAKEGSITRAAQVLGYVQSNVTARVQQLESELQTQLFYRQKGMVLTPTGEKLLTYAERILHLLDEAHKALSDSDEPAGRLQLGANSKVAAIHLPSVLADYHKAFPNVDLSLIASHEEDLIYKVRHFQLDAVFVKTSVPDDSLVADLVFEEDLVLICGPQENTLKEACEKPFLMNSVGCPYRGQLERWLQSIGIGDLRFMEFNHLDAIIGGVMAGLGASLVPQSAIQNYEALGRLRTFSIPPEYRTTRTYLVRHRDSLMTSALTKFMEMLEESTAYRPLNTVV